MTSFHAYFYVRLFLMLHFYVFMNLFKILCVCVCIRGVYTELYSSCFLILHVLSFLECGLQIKNISLNIFFARVLWFLRNDLSKLLLLLLG